MVKCVYSVLQQTFTDYELILVDDGSTDRSGTLCDELLSTDSRIRVIHQRNKGLSAARNAGIRVAEGTYIAFIDSDDEYGTTTLLQENMELILRHPEADFVQFPSLWCRIGEGEQLLSVAHELHLSGSEILTNYRDQVITSLAWDKIFHSRVFDIAMFLEGKIHEDILFMVDILPKIRHVICSNKGYYQYFLRAGSLSQSKYTLEHSVQRMDALTKALSLFEGDARDSFHYLNGFRFNLQCLAESCRAYGISTFESTISTMQKQCLSIPVICKYAGKFRKRELAKIWLVKVIGVHSYLKIIRRIYSC